MMHFSLTSKWTFLQKLYLAFLYPFVRTVSDDDVTLLINTVGLQAALTDLAGKSISPKSSRLLKAFQIDQGIMPNRPKKIAVCLSGDLRSFIHCQEKIRRFFAGHDVHYFCHTWADGHAVSSLDMGAQFWIKDEKRPDFTALERQSIASFGLKAYGKDKKVPYMSTNLFPMWHGVKQAFGLIEEEGFSLDDFDLVARCRYDNYFLGQLEQYQGDWLDDKVVIDSNYHGYGGFGDQFAVGTPEAMRVYCHLFDWFEVAFIDLRGKDRFFAEVVIKDYLKTKKMAVEQVNFGLRLLRAAFVGLPDDQIPLRSHATSTIRNDQVSQYIKEKFPDLYEKG